MSFDSRRKDLITKVFPLGELFYPIAYLNYQSHSTTVIILLRCQVFEPKNLTS